MIGCGVGRVWMDVVVGEDAASQTRDGWAVRDRWELW